MDLAAIQVECHSGQRADETPRRFLLEAGWIEVVAVVDRWYQLDNLLGWPRAEYFKVRDPAERVYLLKHDQDADQWFLVGPAPGAAVGDRP